MGGERVIPSTAPKSVCTHTVKVDGVEVSQAYHLLSVSVSNELNKIPSAVLIYADGNVAKETFPISDEDVFVPGKTLEVLLGYAASNEVVFRGIIVKHSIKIREGVSVLMVEAKDALMAMTLTPKSKYFYDQSDSEIIESLLQSYGISNNVEDTSLKHETMVQVNASDWDFMQCRMDMNGLYAMSDGQTVRISKIDLGAETVLDIQNGSTIYKLDAEIDARLQFDQVKGNSWLPDQQNRQTEEADTVNDNLAGDWSASDLSGMLNFDTYHLNTDTPLQSLELKTWLNAKMQKHRLAKIRGVVTTEGTDKVWPGQFIELHGVGKRFSGKLFVSGVFHQLSDGRWLTTYQFGIDPRWFVQKYDVPQPLASAQVPAIQGLHIGVVTKLEGDPLGEHRIQVAIPIIHKSEEGAWCRISAPDAGNNRGFFMRPEIGDEVVVGFLNNDPRFGIVLGMLNSSSHPAPFTESDDNHQKGYTSRNGLEVHFNDDKKTIRLRTPNGNSVLLGSGGITLKDQNGNEMKMDDEGISITSVKQFIVQAGKDVEILSGDSIKVEAGNSINIKASMKMDMWSATAMTIKGAIVKIN